MWMTCSCKQPLAIVRHLLWDAPEIYGMQGKILLQCCNVHSIVCNMVCLYPGLAGVATIFAQFDIDQFRSIAWYNAAAGMALIVLQFVIFRGESKCKKLPECSMTCCWKITKSSCESSCFGVVISF